MNDKIKYIHVGLQGGLGSPIACSFVGSESAEGSAHEDSKRDTGRAHCEEADRSLQPSWERTASFERLKTWFIGMIETGFAHPRI
jgi:hypothetical protein